MVRRKVHRAGLPFFLWVTDHQGVVCACHDGDRKNLLLRMDHRHLFNVQFVEAYNLVSPRPTLAVDRRIEVR